MKTKIVVLGLGGVGGYYGGLLARKYEKDPSIEVFFVARGENLQKIKENGLCVITENETFVARPTLATDNVSEIGIADYIIVATKSYDLENTIEQIKPCIGKDTVVLPLLNGLDISGSIRKLLPQVEVWDGCVYIVARLNQPGVVESSGNVHLLHFGCMDKATPRLFVFQGVLHNAGVEAHLSENILSVIWRKFFFISTTASLTSYFDVNFRGLCQDESKMNMLYAMLDELFLIAEAEKVKIDRTVIDAVVKQLKSLPAETTTSMHSDYKAGKSTELHTLTGVVVQLAQKYNISVPIYNKVYEELKRRTR